MIANAKLTLAVLAAGLAACGGKRATTGATTGNASGGGAGAPVVLPGACVDPVADATTRQGHTDQEPDDRPGPDLDGDGTADLQVLTTDPEGLVTEHVFIYVVRGGCGHYVGEIVTSDPALGADRHHGLVDLNVTDNLNCEGARCGCETGTWVYRFDGTSYVKDPGASTDSSENECDD